VIRRHVARARGRALRAAGLPRVPNAPSGRALVQRELRAAARPVRVGAPRRRSGTSVPAGGDRRASGDVGLAPLLVALVGVVVAVVLLLAAGVPDAPPPPADTCYDRVVYHGAQLRDC
jgi:hypothetical protein